MSQDKDDKQIKQTKETFKAQTKTQFTSSRKKLQETVAILSGSEYS